MTLDPLAAHALALALVALDQGARALRLALLARALGHPFSVRAALVTNVVGDAACAVTPMRLGGEPARLGVMLRHGLPATAAFVVVALEVVTMWPVILATIAGLALAFAPRWLGETAPVLAAGLGRLWGWFALAAVVSVAVWALARRSARAGPRLVRRPWRRVRVYWRRLPAGVLVASCLLAFVNLATRVAILPVLMAMRPDAPPLGPALLGSFALLYSQLVLPTPSGAGVVDLGLLAGVAGPVGGSEVPLLFWWRFYTTGVGVALGGWVGLRLLGRARRGA